MIPDAGEIMLAGKVVNFRTPLEAREAGIETVFRILLLSPALSIADNMFLGREIRLSGARGRFFRTLDRSTMQRIAREKLSELGLMTIQNINQPVETLSGGQKTGRRGRTGGGFRQPSRHHGRADGGARREGMRAACWS